MRLSKILFILTTVMSISACARAIPRAPLGTWNACFWTYSDNTRRACGTLTLTDTPVCDQGFWGEYQIPFDSLSYSDSAGISKARPPLQHNRWTFTWHLDGSTLRMTDVSRRWPDSHTGPGCVMENGGTFEAEGRLSPTSVTGRWGSYEHYLGYYWNGSFSLIDRRRP